MQWKTVLVPYDFSASSEHAVQIASHEAKVHGGRVVLLHIVELVPQFGPDTTLITRPGTETPVSQRQYFIETAETDLAAVAAKITAGGVEATCHVRSGIPVDEITTFVHDHPVDLIVMGTHGRTGLKRMILGSVAEKLVRISSVPVLTIRHPDPPRT